MALFSITHEGVPIGRIDLDPSQRRTEAVVALLPAYDAIRPIVQATTRALLRASAAYVAEPHAAPLNPENHVTDLGKRLELLDTMGQLVPTDFIELRDWSVEVSQVHALVGFRTVPAGRPANTVAPRREGPDSAPPAA